MGRKLRIGDDLPSGATLDELGPTRRTLMLRRRRANVSRRRHGRACLPELRPGDCMKCWGEGVVYDYRCDQCGGSG